MTQECCFSLYMLKIRKSLNYCQGKVKQLHDSNSQPRWKSLPSLKGEPFCMPAQGRLEYLSLLSLPQSCPLCEKTLNMLVLLTLGSSW